MSQNFISEVINKDEPQVEKINHLPKKKYKTSFFEHYSSLDRGKVEGGSKLDTKALGKENETISYNLSGTLQSKRFEFSGKVNFLKSRSLTGVRQFLKVRPSKRRLLREFLADFQKEKGLSKVAENVEDWRLFLLFKGSSENVKFRFLERCKRFLKSQKSLKKNMGRLLRVYKRSRKLEKKNLEEDLVNMIRASEQLVKREIMSKGANKNFKFVRSSKKKDDTVTTKEILTCQSTNKLNNQIKDSYMFSNSYKTGQKRKKDAKNLQTRTSYYNMENVHSSVMNYSDMSKTNMSNHLKKKELSEKGRLQEQYDTFGKVNQTKRKKKSLNKENKAVKGRKRRPPMRCVASAMKLTREQVFGKQDKQENKESQSKGKKNEKKEKTRESQQSQSNLSVENEQRVKGPFVKHLYQGTPGEKRESETDRMMQKKMNLNSLDIDTHKSLISNFWNEKLTKRQSLQQSKLKTHLRKPKVEKQLENKATQVKWGRRTVKSLRDKGLELKPLGTTGGESLLSSKQETSLIKGSMRRVSATGMIAKNKSPTKVFKKSKMSALKIKKMKKRVTVGSKDQQKAKMNKSIKMNLKGNFRKMKSISPPSNWSMTRFNKMKNTFFKKKKIETFTSKNTQQKEDIMRTDTKSSNSATMSGGKKVFSDKESPQEIGSSANFYCNNPYANLGEKPRICRMLAKPLESEKSPTETVNENGNKFFKKTLPEISEGETNESSEHTVIMSSSKKKIDSPVTENGNAIETKMTKFKSNRQIAKNKKKDEKKNDVIQRNSVGVNVRSPLQSRQKFKKKSPLGKRLLKQSKPRQPSRSTNEFKNFMKDPYTSEEISNSSRNHNLRKNFEELSKQMKKNSDRFYLGNPRILEKNEDTRFKILNAKRSIKRKSKVDGSRLTDNGREGVESQETELIQSDAIKTNSNNFLNSRKRSHLAGPKHILKKENRSLDTRAKRKPKGAQMQTPEQMTRMSQQTQGSLRPGDHSTKGSHLEQNRSLDKAKFYLPRNLKVFKSSKMSLINFEKHKLSQQKTIHTRSELKRVPFMNKKKKVKMNGSQDSFKTQDIIQKRFKPSKGPRQKGGLMIIKKKIQSKNALLKARSFDKSRLLKDNGIGAFTFGK